MAKRPAYQFTLKTAFLATSYFAIIFAWLGVWSRRVSADDFLPGPSSVLGAGLGIWAYWRARSGSDAAGTVCLIALGAHLAELGVIRNIIISLQTVSSHGPIDRHWMQTQLQTAIVAELTLPLCALLPAALGYIHRWPRRPVGAILMIGLSIVFATMSAAMAVMVVFAASFG